MRLYRTTISGKHETGETYDYKIGICTEPLPKEHPGCAVIQEKKVDKKTQGICVGRLNATTVVESKLYD